MLNCAYYPIDIERVEWPHFTTNMKYTRFTREKVDSNDAEGTIRVTALWPETIRLLNAVKKMNLNDRFVFVADKKSENGISGNTLRKRFIAAKKWFFTEFRKEPKIVREQ